MRAKILFVILLNILCELSLAKELVNSFEIISAEGASKLIQQCSRQNPEADSFWTPSKQQIEKLEVRFKDCIPSSVVSLNKYLRQYSGIVRKNKKIIYLNAIETQYAKNGKKLEPKIMCDGDESAFGVEYNVETDEFTFFEFNGPNGRAIHDKQLRSCKVRSK